MKQGYQGPDPRRGSAKEAEAAQDSARAASAQSQRSDAVKPMILLEPTLMSGDQSGRKGGYCVPHCSLDLWQSELSGDKTQQRLGEVTAQNGSHAVLARFQRAGAVPTLGSWDQSGGEGGYGAPHCFLVQCESEHSGDTATLSLRWRDELSPASAETVCAHSLHTHSNGTWDHAKRGAKVKQHATLDGFHDCTRKASSGGAKAEPTPTSTGTLYVHSTACGALSCRSDYNDNVTSAAYHLEERHFDDNVASAAYPTSGTGHGKQCLSFPQRANTVAKFTPPEPLLERPRLEVRYAFYCDSDHSEECHHDDSVESAAYPSGMGYGKLALFNRAPLIRSQIGENPSLSRCCRESCYGNVNGTHTVEYCSIGNSNQLSTLAAAGVGTLMMSVHVIYHAIRQKNFATKASQASHWQRGTPRVSAAPPPGASPQGRQQATPRVPTVRITINPGHLTVVMELNNEQYDGPSLLSQLYKSGFSHLHRPEALMEGRKGPWSREELEQFGVSVNI